MNKPLAMLFLCVASGLSGMARAETFVIQSVKSGHEAVVTIPVSAVTNLSANFAESLDGYADPRVEAMRLSGDVLISIAGSDQPIHIKADSMVLELTADPAPEPARGGRAAPGRAALGRAAVANRVLRSGGILPNGDAGQVFVGNVVFDLQTNSGPMEIKADRVEHQLDTGSMSNPGA